MEVEESAQPRVAVCATHAGAQSTGACERCGNFICPLCLDEFSGLPDHCEDCREREGGGLIAFERDDAGLLRRWWRTVKDVLFRPTRTFETVRPSSLGAAVGFGALTGAIVVSVIASIGLCAAGLIAVLGAEPATGPTGLATLVAMLVGYVVLFPLFVVLGAGVRTSVFHASVKLLGGDGGIAASFWALSYLQATTVLLWPLLVVRAIPGIGPFLGLLALLAIEVFYALQLTTVARRYHSLSEGRATMAGWSIFVTGITVTSLCCLLSVFAL